MIPTMIFAADVAITWEWMVDDPQVSGFRYQLNDENPDNWTVVDANTTMAVIQNLDGSKEYSLYLQQTFDGVNWSESSVSVAMPLYGADEEMMDDMAAPMDEMAASMDDMEAPMDEMAAPMDEMAAPKEDMDVAEEMAEPMDEMVEPMKDMDVAEEMVEPMDEMAAPMEDMDVAEEMTETMDMESEAHEKRNHYYTSLGLNVGGIYSLNPIIMSDDTTTYNKFQPALNLALGFNNILSPGKTVGFGLNFDIDLLGYVDGSKSFTSTAQTFFTEDTDFSLRVALTPEMEINTKHFVLDLGVIGDVTFVGNQDIIGLQADLTPSFDWFDYGVFSYGAKAGLAYKFNSGLQYVIDGSIRKANDFDITDGDWSINGFTGLKFTY
jgi:hypothetical protein